MKTRWAAVVMLAITLAVQAAETRTDPEQKYAWGENIGWVNAGPSNHAVRIHFDGDQGWLSGYAWGGKCRLGQFSRASESSWR